MICRQCGSEKLNEAGALPDGKVFGGMPLTPALPGGALYECRDCDLWFRAPILDEADYRKLYSRLPHCLWAMDEGRQDVARVRKAIQRRSSGRVLDVGCYTGDLLDSLGSGFEKYGIEPSTAATRVAAARGITVLGPDLSHVDGQLFDVICAVDVIEHVASPLKMLQAMAQHLAPGGEIIVSTGNTASRAFFFHGASYWYCACPEHLSFISPKWAKAAAANAGLTLERVELFRHRELSLTYKCKGWVRAVAHEMLALAERVLTKRARFAVGTAGLFEDHFLAVFAR